MKGITCIIALLSISLLSYAQSVTITYLANEGVMIEDEKSKILIDPFFKETFSQYQKLPIIDFPQFMNQHPELKAADAILISHKHLDHIDAGWVAEYMKANIRTVLISSSQATDSVVNYFKIPKERVVNLLPEMNEELAVYVSDKVKLQAAWLRHGYEPNYKVVNLCFLIESGGKKIFHMGDTEIKDDVFQKIDFVKEKIDVLLIPFWFLTNDEGASIVSQRINPEKIVAIHLSKISIERPKEILKRFPKAVLFETLFEKILVN